MPDDDVIYRRLDDGAVIYHSTDEVYYGLNEVGAAIWELLPPTCHTVADLTTRLAQQYREANRVRLHADVVELIESLTRYGLLHVPAGVVA